jgi:hypothetical protein
VEWIVWSWLAFHLCLSFRLDELVNIRIPSAWVQDVIDAALQIKTVQEIARRLRGFFLTGRGCVWALGAGGIASRVG